MSHFIKTVFLFFVISSCSKEISETTSVETEEPEVIEGSTLPLIHLRFFSFKLELKYEALAHKCLIKNLTVLKPGMKTEKI